MAERVEPERWKNRSAVEFRATGLAFTCWTPSACAASTAVSTSERPMPWPRTSKETTTGSISACLPRMSEADEADHRAPSLRDPDPLAGQLVESRSGVVAADRRVVVERPVPARQLGPETATRGRVLLLVTGESSTGLDTARHYIDSARMIRPGTPQDARFLRDMLRHAYYWRSSGTEDESGLHPMRYVENWGRPGDAAVIALDEGFPVGAAWYRTLQGERAGLRLRRRADARALDRGRAQPARPRLRRRADGCASRAGARGGLPGDQPQRRLRQPCGAPLRALRLREGRRARRRMDDARAALASRLGAKPLHRFWAAATR